MLILEEEFTREDYTLSASIIQEDSTLETISEEDMRSLEEELFEEFKEAIQFSMAEKLVLEAEFFPHIL